MSLIFTEETQLSFFLRDCKSLSKDVIYIYIITFLILAMSLTMLSERTGAQHKKRLISPCALCAVPGDFSLKNFTQATEESKDRKLISANQTFEIF